MNESGGRWIPADPWQTTWIREADKVKELAENNAHLRAALVKAEADRDTWRQRAEEAEEVVTGVVEDRDAYANTLFAAERTVREQREAKDHAYWERNQLVRVLSVMYPSYIALSDDPDWPIVYVELTTGQASWHIPATEIPTFNHLEWEPAGWDGHTDAEKYARLAALAPVADERTDA